MSSATAYLQPIMKRPNLTVQTGARVTRILTERATARGVSYQVDGGIRTAEARREVDRLRWFNQYAPDPDAVGYRPT